MNTLLKTDIEIATHVAMYGGTEKDALRLRRRSEPLTRKKSSMSYLSARSETDTAVATDVRSPSKAACHCYRLFFFLFFFLTCPPFLPRSFSLIVYLSFCLILFSSLGLSLSLLHLDIVLTFLSNSSPFHSPLFCLLCNYTPYYRCFLMSCRSPAYLLFDSSLSVNNPQLSYIHSYYVLVLFFSLFNFFSFLRRILFINFIIIVGLQIRSIHLPKYFGNSLIAYNSYVRLTSFNTFFNKTHSKPRLVAILISCTYKYLYMYSILYSIR